MKLPRTEMDVSTDAKYAAREPCKSCPYRKDAPLGYWSEEEFENLESAERSVMGAVFGCHQDGKKPKAEVGVCVGWLLDQKRRNYPSVALRLSLTSSPRFAEQANAVSQKGLRLWASVPAMIAANRKAIFHGRIVRKDRVVARQAVHEPATDAELAEAGDQSLDRHARRRAIYDLGVEHGRRNLRAVVSSAEALLDEPDDDVARDRLRAQIDKAVRK